MGNLDSLRDWGHARDYVEMQWLMLQNETPKDYVIATGRMETVRKFCELSAFELGWNRNGERALYWEGSGIDEIGKIRSGVIGLIPSSDSDNSSNLSGRVRNVHSA